MSLQHDVALMTAADVEEAASRVAVLPKGRYEAQITDSKGIETSELETFPSGDPNPYYGLPSVFLTATLYAVPDPDGSTRDRKKGFAVSAHKVVTSRGLGMPSRNYAMLSKALGLSNPPLADLEQKALNGPRITVVVGNKGYIDRIEAAE